MLIPRPPMSTRFPYTTLFRSYRPNRGKGYAVRTGMLRATGRYRLFADAGLCVPFAEIEKGLALLEAGADVAIGSRKMRSEEHTSELQSPMYLVCRLLLEKKNK